MKDRLVALFGYNYDGMRSKDVGMGKREENLTDQNESAQNSNEMTGHPHKLEKTRAIGNFRLYVVLTIISLIFLFIVINYIDTIHELTQNALEGSTGAILIFLVFIIPGVLGLIFWFVPKE